MAHAVTLGLVEPRRLARIQGRLRRRARELPSVDVVWIEELVRTGHLTRYQGAALLRAPEADVALSLDERPMVIQADPLTIGPYSVLDRVGRSDLGSTYRCRPQGEQRLIVVKRLDSSWSASGTLLDCLSAAADAWQSFSDPRVVTWQCSELEHDVPVLVSPWVSAESLGTLLRAGRRLSASAAMMIWSDLVSALAAADTHGLVHGDLRPAHVLIERSGQVRLIECGVRSAVPGAGLSAARGLAPERYDYVAPEVAADEREPDAVSDIYALGCLLYHMIVGSPPFGGGDASRKLAAHRSGSKRDLKRWGVSLPGPVCRVLEATLRPDRSGRVGSYNELLNLVVQSPTRARRLRAELAVPPAPCWAELARSAPRARSARGLVWLTATVLAAASAALVLGRSNVLSIWQLPRRLQVRAGGPAEQRAAPQRDSATQPLQVASLWNATEELRAAYRAAPAGGTILLRSPGPFLLDGLEIGKPITLRGAEGARPLFLAGPGAALRITASDVQLENIHVLRVAERVGGQTRSDARALVECSAARLTIIGCSFQNLGQVDAVAGIDWSAPLPESDEATPRLVCRNVLLRQLAAGVRVAGVAAVRLDLENCVHLGPGPLVASSSATGEPFDAVELTLCRVTVCSAAAVEHSFPHPMDRALPLKILADYSLFVPAQRAQPILRVHYAAAPPTLMPLVSWSGSHSLCPADATMIEVARGSEPSWRAADIAAWKAYWGSHATGLVGLRSSFVASAPADVRQLPRLGQARQPSSGADPELLVYPTPLVLEQLPLLMERLAAR